MGNTKQALELITNELRDVDKAIDFCKEHDDSELWLDLINYSMDKPCAFHSFSIHLFFVLANYLICHRVPSLIRLRHQLPRSRWSIDPCRAIFVAAFITGLLHNIGTHVDPIILIQKIRDGLEIPGLRDSLVKILQDYNLQVRKKQILH